MKGAGLILQYFDTAPRPQIVWTAATLPAIALLSMSATLVLGQPLATIVLAIIYAGGTVLEDFARGRAERELILLTDRSPRIAHRKCGPGLETIPVEQVAIGDLLLVRAGEVLPVDGLLVNGEALLDESAGHGRTASGATPQRQCAAQRHGQCRRGVPYARLCRVQDILTR